MDTDWDPGSETVLRDPPQAYDGLRERCPIAYSERLGCSLLRHADVVRVLHDTDTFSSRVSRHTAVPNGMDPPEHTAFRRAVEPPFAPARMRAFEPASRRLAAALVDALPRTATPDLMAALARPFAARVQCDFLGWPAAMHRALLQWTTQSQAATLAGDREALARLAAEFRGHVVELLAARRRQRRADGDPAQPDATDDLLRAQVDGRPLDDDELVSVLRNWTVGEVGTIAASVGILGGFLAVHPDLQAQLRRAPADLPAAIDEVLRLHGPLVANRRVTTRPARIAGRWLEAGQGVTLIWPAANRDGRAFDDPGAFRLDRDPQRNLLYGAGIHACPGAPLARLELRVLMEELLARTAAIEPGPAGSARHAAYPAGGWATLPLEIR